jgi:hypothetical protein
MYLQLHSKQFIFLFQACNTGRVSLECSLFIIEVVRDIVMVVGPDLIFMFAKYVLHFFCASVTAEVQSVIGGRG